MNEYTRARSDEQKAERMEEIKNSAISLFEEYPYTEITLTTIAERLKWSRANLYKYVTTKEEIFLEITKDKMQAYYGSLKAAFPQNNGFSKEIIAEVWAGIINANKEYMRYVAYLSPIIETNVTVERLAIFKKAYYDEAFIFCELLKSMLNISEEKAYSLQLDVLMYSSSKMMCCYNNPLIIQALELLKIKAPQSDFLAEVKDFILMKLERL